METSAWDLSLGKLLLGELSLENCRVLAFVLGSFVWELSLWKCHSGTFALELALKNFGLETVAWVSFGGTSLGNFSLGNSALDLWLWVFA